MTPSSLKDFNARFKASQRPVGKDGIDHVPCQFCGAPDFILLPSTTNPEAALKAGGTCSECGRSACALVVTKEPTGRNRYEWVQTGGDMPPKWHLEAFGMRRVR